MKLNFTVEINQDDEYFSLEDELIHSASNEFISQVLGSKWDDESLYDKLEKSVVKKLENIMDVDFKNSVAEKVTENLAKKFEKTKQYKILKSGGEVIADNVIKSGLKEIIAEVVKSEMKNLFK